MSSNKYSLLVSVGLSLGLSFLLAFISAAALLGGLLYPVEPPLIIKILSWNIILAGYLINLGLLPACKDCEMTVLLYVIFYGFIIGLIGYSIAFFCGISLIKKFRR